MNFIELPLPKAKRISHIVHLADIHIREGDLKKSRYDEYQKVICRLGSQLETLSSVKNGTAVIALMGDIFENKVLLTASGCALFHLLIGSLSQIAPLYILQGNHDFQQGLPDEPGLLDSLLLNVPDNVYYLNKTGHYVAGDLGIGVVCVRDIHKLGYGSGYVADLPLFPPSDQFPEIVKTKLAFLHATISGCRLQNYHPEQKGLPIDWIKGYDACLLGDIHLNQVHNASVHSLVSLNNLKGLDQNQLDFYASSNTIHEWVTNTEKMVWGYPGSLVQQNMGENAYDVHGYLLWNIDDKVITSHHIQNEYAMIGVKYNTSTKLWETRIKTDWVPLVNNLKNFKNIKVRIHGSFTAPDLSELHSLLEDNNIKYEVVRGLINRKIPTLQGNTIEPCQLDKQEVEVPSYETYNTPNAWIEYLENNTKLDKTRLSSHNWQEWLRNPLTLQLSTDLADKTLSDMIEQRNKIIRGFITDLNDSLKMTPPKVWINLKCLSWQWLFCYGENNWLNFETMMNNICTANAPNSKGKSALFDIICLAIFGQPTPLRGNTNNLICQSKPEGTAAKTQLLLEIDGQKYCFIRTFSRKINNSIQSKCIIYREQDGNYHEYLGDSSSNKWIKANIGDLSDFILSTMVTQTTQEDFFNMPNKKQIEHLDLALNQVPYTNLIKLFHEVKNALHQLESKQEAIMGAFAKNIKKVDIVIEERTKIAHNSCVEKINQLEVELKSLQKEIKHDPIYVSEVTDAVLTAFINAHSEKLLPDDKRDKDPKNNLVYTKVEFEKVKNYYDKSFIPENSGKRVTLEPKTKHNDIRVEEELMKEWQKRYSTFSYDPMNMQKLGEHELLIKTYNSELAQIIIPEISGTYEEYELKYNEAMEIIEDLRVSCGKNPLIMPSMSESLNNERSANLEIEIKNISSNCDWTSPTFETDYIELERMIQENKDYCASITNEIRNLSGVQEPIKPLTVAKPYISKTDVAKWLFDLKEMSNELDLKMETYQKNSEILEKIKTNNDSTIQINNEIQDLKGRIEEIRDQKIAHNPDCWACKLQPWVTHLEGIENLYDTKLKARRELESIYDKDLKSFDNPEFFSLTNTLNKWLTRYNSLSKDKETYLNLVNAWESYDDYEKVYNDYELKRHHYLLTKDNTIKLQIVLTQKVNELNQLEKQMVSMSMCRQNMVRWKETRTSIEECRLQIIAYDMAKKLHNELENCNKVIEERKGWDMKKRYMDLKEKLLESTNTLQQCVENEKLKTTYDQECILWKIRKEVLDKNREIFEKWKTDTEYNLSVDAYHLHAKLIELENHVEWLQWSTIKNNRILLNKEKNLLIELDELRNEKDKLLISETTNQNASQLYQKQYEQLLTYEVQLKNIRDKHKAVSHLMELFTEFKYWIYSTKILPSLLAHTNGISGLIANQSAKLNAVVDSNMEMNWIISDESINTQFSYGGGFDKFLFGFAIRLAIARIGACRVVSKQLFIDEGFVAADKEHLSLVPSLLDNLLDIYPTILLVTHIESLRNEQYLNIEIKRNKKISTIQYGDKDGIKIVKSNDSEKEAIKATQIKVLPIVSAVSATAISNELSVEAVDQNRCVGKTAKGTRCTNKKKIGDYCGKHASKIIES